MFVQMVREVAKGEPLPPFAPRQGLMRNVMDYRPRQVLAAATRVVTV